jgi:hypothetical protein
MTIASPVPTLAVAKTVRFNRYRLFRAVFYFSWKTSRMVKMTRLLESCAELLIPALIRPSRWGDVA